MNTPLQLNALLSNGSVVDVNVAQTVLVRTGQRSRFEGPRFEEGIRVFGVPKSGWIARAASNLGFCRCRRATLKMPDGRNDSDLRGRTYWRQLKSICVSAVRDTGAQGKEGTYPKGYRT